MTNPATGEVLARVPLSSRPISTPPWPPPGALSVWRAVSVIERARRLFALREGLDARREDLARSVTTEMGKTIGDARAEVARMIEMVECACAIPTTCRAASWRTSPATWTPRPCASRWACRRDRAVQLPRHGALLVPALRDRLRQQLRPEALRAGATHPADRLRGPGLARPAAGRGQPGQRRPRGRRGILDHPGIDAVSFVGSAPVARIIYERSAKAGKRVQALGGAKNHGRDAGRRGRPDGEGDRLGLRGRGPALHGRLGGGHRGRGARPAHARARRGHRGAAGGRRSRRGRRRRAA